jgi:hypothetical protein
VHQDVAGLANAERAVGRLVLDGRVPPTIEMHDVGSGGEVEASATSLE